MWSITEEFGLDHRRVWFPRLENSQYGHQGLERAGATHREHQKLVSIKKCLELSITEELSVG